MSVALRRALAVAGAVAVTVAVGALSQVPYQFDRADHAVLRLAWRTRGVRVEECRALTAEELANLPPHMRRTEVCEGRLLPYRLRVSVDGEPMVDDLIRPAGARADRPLYVFHDVVLASGDHDVTVTFSRDSLASLEAEAGAATPVSVRFDERVTVAARDILLITYDPDGKRLVTVAP